MAVNKKEEKMNDKKRKIVIILFILAIVFSILSIVVNIGVSQINAPASADKRTSGGNAGDISFIVETNEAGGNG